jgi:hypothetical protein
MNRLILIALALGLSLTGCGGSHDTPNGPQATSSSVVPTAGRIALGIVPVGLKRTGQVATDSLPPVDTATSIELGTLKTSKAFFFIIRNVGSAPIESLTVATDNLAVSMTPGYIPVLNTDQTSSLQQIAEMDVTHGTDLLSRSYRKALLPYGRQTFKLVFDGVSAGLPFHAEFKIGMAAVYVDLAEFTDSLTVPHSILLPKASYGGTTCGVSVLGRPVAVGDTLNGAAYDYLRQPALFTSDCVTVPAVAPPVT